MSLTTFLLIISFILAVIFFILYDNLKWQERLLKQLNAAPKPKIKLKKGQRIVFSEKKDEFNPFEEY